MSPDMTASRLSRAEQVRERRIKVGGLFGILKRCQAPCRPQMSVPPHGSELTPIAKPLGDGTLVKALARAWRWQKLLDDSVYASLSESGNSENISKSYMSLVLRLALLARISLRRSSEEWRTSRRCWSGLNARCGRAGPNNATTSAGEPARGVGALPVPSFALPDAEWSGRGPD